VNTPIDASEQSVERRRIGVGAPSELDRLRTVGKEIGVPNRAATASALDR
jgi:hypothetical protein